MRTKSFIGAQACWLLGSDWVSRKIQEFAVMGPIERELRTVSVAICTAAENHGIWLTTSTLACLSPAARGDNLGELIYQGVTVDWWSDAIEAAEALGL